VATKKKNRTTAAKKPRAASKAPAKKRAPAKKQTSTANKKRASKKAPAQASAPLKQEVDSIAEIVGALTGRAVYAPTAYREVADPRDGETADVCGGCEVDCCSNYVIPLNVTDAYRIWKALRLPWTSFAAMARYPSAAPTWPVRLPDGGAMLALRRRRGSCPFVMRLAGQRRCGIHALRPTACRLFPFLPDDDAQRRSPVGMMAQRPPRDCPWRWPNSPEAIEALDQLIAESQRLRTLDVEVLRTWHRQMNMPHTEENFFIFLEQEMERRDRGGDEPSPWITRLW
jgi:Fe-S-cluster containining protein